MAITGHKKEQSLADYDDLDLEDHLHVGEVLSGKKPSEVAVKTHQQTLLSLSSPPVSGSFPSLPMVFQNRNVTFGSTIVTSFSQSQSSPAMMTISQSSTSYHNRKRHCIIYSDSDSD